MKRPADQAGAKCGRGDDDGSMIKVSPSSPDHARLASRPCCREHTVGDQKADTHILTWETRNTTVTHDTGFSRYPIVARDDEASSQKQIMMGATNTID